MTANNSQINDRLTALETTVKLKIESLEKEIANAKVHADEIRNQTTKEVDHRLLVLNDHQTRMDGLQRTIVVKEAFEIKMAFVDQRFEQNSEKFSNVYKLIYIGVGLLLAVQFAGIAVMINFLKF